MSAIEIVAVTFSFLCVVLSIARSVWTWPVGQIGIIAYLILFYQQKLYADAILQLVFIVQGFYGWYHWHTRKREEKAIVIFMLTNNWRFATVLSILMIAFLWGLALERYTDAALPYIDATAATISFVATWLMARKKLESWILWIIADMVYVGLFWYKGLYLSSGIYLVFLVLAVAGLMEWNKKLASKLDLR